MSNAPTFLYAHPDCALHDPAPHKGFAPARLDAVLKALKDPAFKDLAWHDAPPATESYLSLFHTPEHIASVLQVIPEGEQRAFDFETFAMSGTAQAALRSAGLVQGAVDAVIKGEARNAFCAVSPGGHHAEADCALGYCFFNHAALGALWAQQNADVSRVTIFDFDAHHGNGTQSAFWNHENRLYVSLHEDNALSGFANEHGAWNNVLNIPLPAESDGALFRDEVECRAFPKIEDFKADLMIVSAGFDMHADDPLSRLRLGAADYAWLGEKLAALADRIGKGRLVSVMEGGYNLEALGACAAAFVQGLMKET
jgi:acetoin utilization deacetylase AcuC-like enzyme